ncbi:bcl-2-related ovarian killer protein homolog A-like isoform 3-T3 [Polymixia lowei]
MEVLRRSSEFAAEVLEVFDRSVTEKELVSQSKALCRDYIHSRLNQNGLGWSKAELNLPTSNAALSEVSLVLLCLGDELEYMRPSLYRNVARQLNRDLLNRHNMGEGGVCVCSSWGSCGRLCQTRPSGHGVHLGGQPGPVCPQIPGVLAEETGRMGGNYKMCSEEGSHPRTPLDVLGNGVLEVLSYNSICLRYEGTVNNGRTDCTVIVKVIV